jgi:hypothetical protein
MAAIVRPGVPAPSLAPLLRLLPAYARAYAGRSHLGGAYAERIEAVLVRLRERYGLRGETFGRCSTVAAPRQLGLWAGDGYTRGLSGQEPMR